MSAWNVTESAFQRPAEPQCGFHISRGDRGAMQAILRSDPTKCLGKLRIPVLFVFFLIPLICDAQVQQTQQNSTSEVAASADGGDSNDAVLQELQAMRNRIEQLEAQLKVQSAAKSDTTSAEAKRLESARQSLVAADTDLLFLREPRRRPHPQQNLDCDGIDLRPEVRRHLRLLLRNPFHLPLPISHG